MLRVIVVLGISVICLAATAGAAKIYQWRDSMGVTHITDNPTRVPAEHRYKASRNVKPMEGMKSIVPKKTEEDVKADVEAGHTAFSNYCVVCHTDSKSSPPGKFQLGSLASSSASNNDLFSKLKAAAAGGDPDMPAVKVSDSALKSIALYLRDKNKR
ncbi:MAG: DUF4124 domain-containing protein [Mariprofundaceae bacterium]